MPTKNKKVSPSKTIKNKKPVKASKPAAKPARSASKPAPGKSAAKSVKKPAKPVKASKAAAKPSKPAPKKKPEVKKPVKTAVKAQKTAIKPKPAAKNAAKKAVSLTKGKTSKPTKVVKPVKQAPSAKTKAVKPSKPVVSKAKATPKTTAKPASKAPAKPVSVAAAKKPEAGPKASIQKPVVKDSKPLKTAPQPAENKVPVNENTRKATDVFSKKPNSDRSNSGVLAITNTIPVKDKHEISPSKIALISNSITNPIKKTDSYAVKPEKEPNGKFELEFVIHSSAEMLYEFLSTPSGLSEWFCDDLNIRNGIYTFIWEDQLQQARLLKTVDVHLVRFQWVDKTDGSYFEFRIQRDDLTNDISLIITDFAETVSERESSKLLWHSQIEKLMHVIGSIF